MVPRWENQLYPVPAVPMPIHLQSMPKAEGKGKLGWQGSSRASLFSADSFPFYLFLFSFWASCSHLHAVVVLTKEKCSPVKPVWIMVLGSEYLMPIVCMPGLENGVQRRDLVHTPEVGEVLVVTTLEASKTHQHFDTCLLIKSKHGLKHAEPGGMHCANRFDSCPEPFQATDHFEPN